MSLLGTPMGGGGGWCGGASLHPPVCVPSRCLSPPMVPCAGASPAALTGPSCPLAVGGSTVWGIGMGLHPTLPRVRSDPSLDTDPGGNKGHRGQGQVPAEEGTKTPPIPWLGLCRRVGGCRAASCWHLLPPTTLSSASSRCPRPHRRLSTQRVPIPTRARWGGRREPSSQAGCLLLLLLLSPPGHLGAGRRTIARRMSKMVPIALATHSRAAGARGVRQLPEKHILPRRRGLPAQVAWQPPPSAPRPTSHARTGSAT